MHSVVTQPKGCSMIGSSIPNGIRPFDTSLERIQLSYKPCNPRAREINKGKYGLKQQAQPLQRGGLQMASTPAKGNQACQGKKTKLAQRLNLGPRGASGQSTRFHWPGSQPAPNGMRANNGHTCHPGAGRPPRGSHKGRILMLISICFNFSPLKKKNIHFNFTIKLAILINSKNWKCYSNSHKQPREASRNRRQKPQTSFLRP